MGLFFPPKCLYCSKKKCKGRANTMYCSEYKRDEQERENKRIERIVDELCRIIVRKRG
jgi:hypothetical protein